MSVLILRTIAVWIVPAVALLILWRPLGSLVASGVIGTLFAMILAWVVLVPLVRAAVDLTADFLRCPDPSTHDAQVAERH